LIDQHQPGPLFFKRGRVIQLFFFFQGQIQGLIEVGQSAIVFLDECFEHPSYLAKAHFCIAVMTPGLLPPITHVAVRASTSYSSRNRPPVTT
jgi:hypothetical protein